MRLGGPVLAATLLACTALAAAPGEKPASSCVACHGQLDDSLVEPLHGWEQDVHYEVGLGCESCHGGDPSPELADDPEAAMSLARGFKPAPDRLSVPGFCADCHADSTFMSRYDPQARVDQLAEYRNSVHGRLNAGGDPRPATCIDCHGIHGIRPVDSPDAPVFAPNVPETCARCHADAALMAPYGIPTDQYDDYLGSAHAAALIERDDTAAPACNDCHGNHGATPPGIQSVANVCGQCHGREAKLFRTSIKKDLFKGLEVAECTVCHGNHRIVHPTSELFRSGSAPAVSVGEVTSTEPFSAVLGELEPGEIATAEWSVVLRPHTAADDERLVHHVSVRAGDGLPVEIDATVLPGSTLTPEEPRQASSPELSVTLRVEPLSGVPVQEGDALRYRIEIEARGTAALPPVRVDDRPGAAVHPVAGSVCLTCHSEGDECDAATAEMYGALSTTSRRLREAETLLGQVARAGMDVDEVIFDLNSRGQTAVVEASALIHSFDPTRLVARAEEGREVANEAYAAGEAAREEWQYRRQGLAVSLVLIVLVLVGLGLKIRELDRRRRQARAHGS